MILQPMHTVETKNIVHTLLGQPIIIELFPVIHLLKLH